MFEFLTQLPPWFFQCLIGLFTIFAIICWFAIRRYFDASKEFKNTIYTELEGLYPTPTKWPIDTADIIPILSEKYPRLEIAVHKFSEHLPCYIRGRFNKAWLNYHKDYYQYVPISGISDSHGKRIEFDNTETYKDNFRNNIKNLLKYARQT